MLNSFMSYKLNLIRNYKYNHLINILTLSILAWKKEQKSAGVVLSNCFVIFLISLYMLLDFISIDVGCLTSRSILSFSACIDFVLGSILGLIVC